MLNFKYLGFILLFTSICWADSANINNDARVNFKDLTILANAWQTASGEPNFNPKADIAEPNGLIDTNDLRFLVQNWLTEPNIVLEIYSDGWGNLLKTVEAEQEGIVYVIIEEETPYYDPPWYYAYASRPGYYTELYFVQGIELGLPHTYLAIFDVDLDGTLPYLFNGTIFMTQSFFRDIYLSNTDVNVFDSAYNYLTTFTTDDQGRFANHLDMGYYFFEFYDGNDSPQYHWHDVFINDNYQDFKFPQNGVLLKPNIYIYPEENINLFVQIDFPEYGFITTAIPDYEDGWDISVEPSGLINGQYEYLFYESIQPDRGQYSEGWVITREQLIDFFSQNMAETGFNTKEINDLIDYWIPLLTDYPYYAIYPQYNQQLDSMLRLQFSQQPDNLIRIIYSIRGLDGDYTLPEPQIPSFQRDGFTVVEWGVILK